MGDLSSHNTAQAKRKEISASSWRTATAHGPKDKGERSKDKGPQFRNADFGMQIAELKIKKQKIKRS
jgi:hypothetical protein